MLVEKAVLIVFRKMPSLVAQRPQLRVALKEKGVNPGQVEPHLQITQIAGVKAAQRFLRRIPAGSALLM